MNPYAYILSFLLLIVASSSAKAQEDIKAEKEERIAQTAMPARALKILDSLPFTSFKFYKEADGNKISYEAKTRRSKPDYSIEFDEYGNLEDIEEEVKKRVLSKEEKSFIQRTLDSIDAHNKIERIQRQYLPGEQIQQRLSQKDFDFYELVVAFKNNHNIYRLELLLDTKGRLLKSRKVKRVAYDFIIF